MLFKTGFRHLLQMCEIVFLLSVFSTTDFTEITNTSDMVKVNVL